MWLSIAYYEDRRIIIQKRVSYLCWAFKSKSESASLSVVSDSAIPGTIAYQALLSWNSPGKNTELCCRFLL